MSELRAPARAETAIVAPELGPRVQLTGGTYTIRARNAA